MEGAEWRGVSPTGIARIMLLVLLLVLLLLLLILMTGQVTMSGRCWNGVISRLRGGCLVPNGSCIPERHPRRTIPRRRLFRLILASKHCGLFKDFESQSGKGGATGGVGPTIVFAAKARGNEPILSAFHSSSKITVYHPTGYNRINFNFTFDCWAFGYCLEFAACGFPLLCHR
jgi:hypothetical protein